MNKILLSDRELMAFIGKQESQEVLSFDALVNEVQAYATHEGLIGDKLPWSKTHHDVALGPGELSLWAGINGHGKTVLLSYVMQRFMMQGRRVLIASMEMKPHEILLTLAQQAAGCFPSESYIREYLCSKTNSGWVYDRMGRVPQQCIIGLCYHAKSLGVNHLVVDSLTMCGIGRENYDGQAEFVNELRSAAKVNGLHVHLVCHIRKTEDEYKKIGKFDIRGAGEITDLADKVFLVWRNKKRELRLRQAEQANVRDALAVDGWGVVLQLVKNRQDGSEESYGLEFDANSKRFVSGSSDLR